MQDQFDAVAENGVLTKVQLVFRSRDEATAILYAPERQKSVDFEWYYYS